MQAWAGERKKSEVERVHRVCDELVEFHLKTQQVRLKVGLHGKRRHVCGVLDKVGLEGLVCTLTFDRRGHPKDKGHVA